MAASGEYDQLLHDAEVRLARLKSLYEQYFQGIERLEPTIARKELDRVFELLKKTQPRNTALRFRVQMLVAKYSTYQSYWNRITRQIEEGTFKRDLARAQKRARSSARSSSLPPPEFELDVELDAPNAGVDQASWDFDDSDVDAILGSLAPKKSEPPARRSISPFAKKSVPPAPAEEPKSAAPAGPAPKPAKPPLPPLPGSPPGAAKVPPPPKLPAPSIAAKDPSAPVVPKPPAPPGQRPHAPRPPVPGAASAAQKPAISPPRTTERHAAVPDTPLPVHDQSAMRPVVPDARRPVHATFGKPSAEGRITGTLPVVTARPSPPPQPSPKEQAPRAAEVDARRMRALYENYVEAKRRNNEPVENVKFEALEKSVHQMVPKLREKHGDKRIDFEVVVQNGKVGLKPKVG